MEFFIDYFVPIKAATVFHEDAVKIRNTNQNTYIIQGGGYLPDLGFMSKIKYKLPD